MPAEAPRPERDEVVDRLTKHGRELGIRAAHLRARATRNFKVGHGASGKDYRRQAERDATLADGIIDILARLAQAERRIAELDHECQASMAEIARGRERAEEAGRLAGERTQERDAALGAETAAWISGEVAPKWRLSTMSDAVIRELRTVLLNENDYGLRFKPCLAALLERHIEDRRAAALVSAARETEGGV